MTRLRRNSAMWPYIRAMQFTRSAESRNMLQVLAAGDLLTFNLFVRLS